MADITERLPERIERGAVKRPAYSTEIVRTDGGQTHANARWAEPLARWDINLPPCRKSSADYLAVKALFTAALGSLRTFNFCDPDTGTDVEVRIEGDELQVTFLGGDLVQVSLSLEAAR